MGGGALLVLGPKPAMPSSQAWNCFPTPTPTAFSGQAAPPERPWAQLEPAASGGGVVLPVARHPGSAWHLRSHAVHAILPAFAAPPGDACPELCLVTATVVPGGAGLTALGVPAKQPGGLQGQPGLPWPLDGTGGKPHLPFGWGHTHVHRAAAADQP